jgi:CHAT domain-containing protein
VATVGGARELGRAEVEPLYLALIDLLLAGADHSDADARQALLVEARDALEDLKTSELRDYFHDPCLDAQRKVTPEVIPGALVVYMIPLPDRLALIVGKQGRLESHAVEVTREALVTEVNAFRVTLLKRTTRQYLRHAHRLYEWLIRPLEPDLVGGEYDTLVFVPRGALHMIPMAALRDAEGEVFLIEKIPVAVTPSLSLTDPKPIDRGDVRVLFAGITESVQGFPGLEFVGREREALSDVFPIRSLMNADFVAARFQDEVSRQPFGIVHVASHGEFSADVSKSYLLTYDDRLSMEQLAEVVGTTRFREEGLELLTLSACETAAGDERAALGLAGVAISAGARSALATLWAVNDEASARLVSRFYHHLGDPTLNRAQALQRAQLEVLRNRFTRHPGYWAPYLLISSWL